MRNHTSWLRLVRVLPMLLPAVAPALGSITLTLDKLDPSDGLPMPPSNLVVADLRVDVSLRDYWGFTGLTGFPGAGARHVYARDNQGHVIPSAPGIATPFVTFFSRPRARDAVDRFGTDGEVAVVSAHCEVPGPALFGELELDATANLVTAPEIGASGYIARIVLDLSAVTNPAFQQDSTNIVVSLTQPPGSVTLFESYCRDGFSQGTEVGGTPEDGVDWGIYGIPEPATVFLLGLGFLLWRKR